MKEPGARARPRPHSVLGLFLARGVQRLVVHDAREDGELLVGLAFLVQGLLEELDDLLLAELFGEGPRGAVGGDLVVLHPLGGTDELGVAHGIGAVGLDGLGAFLDEALHGVAGLALGFLAEELKRLLEAVHMAAGLLEMFGEAFLQFLVGGGLGHFGQGLEELILGVVEILELIDQEFTERIDLGHGSIGFRD